MGKLLKNLNTGDNAGFNLLVGFRWENILRAADISWMNRNSDRRGIINARYHGDVS